MIKEDFQDVAELKNQQYIRNFGLIVKINYQNTTTP